MASGWGQNDSHRTQLAYLCTVVSDEIRTALNFDSIRTVQNALHQIKEYLDMAVVPLNLQRLEVLRYKPPQGQSQTVTIHIIMQMFREVNGFKLTPIMILIICLLKMIQDKNLMIKVQEQMTEDMDGEQVRNTIVQMDRALHLTDSYRQNNRQHASRAQANKACRECGKKGHMAATYLIPIDKLYCWHCDMKSSPDTNTCFKKQKEDKKKEATKENKPGNKEDPPKISPRREETSEERRRALSKS